MQHLVLGVSLSVSTILAPVTFAQGSQTSYVSKLGVEVDVRSGSRFLPDGGTAGTVILPDTSTPVPGIPVVPQIQLRGDNVQVNDPTQDYVQVFPRFRPFVHAVQSETSLAAFGKNIVVTYNNSAGLHVSPSLGGVIVDQVQLSGYSVSNDGGVTWKGG